MEAPARGRKDGVERPRNQPPGRQGAAGRYRSESQDRQGAGGRYRNESQGRQGAGGRYRNESQDRQGAGGRYRNESQDRPGAGGRYRNESQDRQGAGERRRRNESQGSWKGSREPRDFQRPGQGEDGSRPVRADAAGARQGGRDFHERDRGPHRKGLGARRGPRRSSGVEGAQSTSRRGDSQTRTDTRRGGGARHAEGEGERLQKVLSRAGLASRREVEDWIRAGRITVNGQPAVLGVRVSSSDQLRLDGRLIRQREPSAGPTVFVVHRSPGESLTQPHADTSEESAEAPAATAMIERLPSRAGRRFITISPMPRVDGGLELVTSDGELGVMLQRTVHKLVSQFSVRILGELSEQQLEGILGGQLDSGEQIEVQTCEPSGGEGANRWYAFVARGASGKEVRQLFERQGAVVSRVQRTHLGPITMERALSRGQFRELTPEELSALMASPDE